MPAINDFPDSKPYFESLPPRELNQLKIQYFEPGSVLVEEGTAAQNSLFLILSGVCFGENRRLLSNRAVSYTHLLRVLIRQDRKGRRLV